MPIDHEHDRDSTDRDHRGDSSDCQARGSLLRHTTQRDKSEWTSACAERDCAISRL
ncbi:MAG: hypothetical protein NZM04_02485 [Methylacidiphilales bacterium]|nr:hypothetical protein [Candidatus Methylacidiphilales bacterium]